MGKNHKEKLAVATAPLANVAARLTITAFTDQSPKLECSASLVDALRLIAAGIKLISNVVEQTGRFSSKRSVDQVDRKREYLGPRKD